MINKCICIIGTLSAQIKEKPRVHYILYRFISENIKGSNK